MRVVTLAAVLCAGCYLPCPQPAAPPPATPAPPAAAPVGIGTAPLSMHQLRVCVLRDGQLALVDAQYRTREGDTVYNGVPFSQAFPLSGGYALPNEWYRRGETIEIRGRPYAKHGMTSYFLPEELVRAGEYRGVPLFVAAVDSLPYVYVPVRPGCEFQPYMAADSVAARSR
jgi:hypothetical protein